MTDSEPGKNSAKGFAGLASRVSDVSEDSAPAAKAPQSAPPTPPSTDSAAPQPAHAEQPARGFAGLSSKVSDVSEDAVDAPQAVPPAPQATAPRPTQSTQKPARVKSPPASKSGKTGWAWVVACVAVFVIWVANSGSGNNSQPPVPSDAATPAAPTISAGAGMEGAAAAASDERMPPVGRNNVLSIPEIRWCKREKIRIDAIEDVMNPAVELEVGAFNAKVDDYNSRCAEFRYRRGQVEQVDRELAAQRESITAASQSQWYQAWAGASDGSASGPASAERAGEQQGAIGSAWGATPEQGAARTDLSQDEQESIDSACGGQKTLYGQAAYDNCVSKKISALKTGPRHVDLTALSVAERESIESACGGQRTLEGPAAYNRCLSTQLVSLKAGPRDIDLSSLSEVWRESIENACSGQKLLEGPAAYNRCLTQKLGRLRNE
ncbi:hypothetical protein [Janthinobacterium sp. PSPC3-1]|uniref:hypothetical protein n=1 Tax=Janthinobacterium sp. PSPC3-1 TaxID=2804653 RepID=UPI003CE7658D